MRWARGIERLTFVIVGLGLVVAAAMALKWPDWVAKRFVAPSGVPAADAQQAIVPLMVGLGVAIAVTAGVFFAGALRLDVRCPRVFPWVALAGLCGVYLALSLPFADWLVDDAAVTFAYSENLVNGHGLVLFPGHPPEEAYSNTLWMLILALARALGWNIPLAAKVLCTVLGCAVIVAAFMVFRCVRTKETSAEEYLCFGAILLGAPFIIWSISGLETTLQMLLFVVLAAGTSLTRQRVWLAAISLACLILVRPETPLVCLALCVAHAVHAHRERGVLGVVALWPMAALPLLTLAALLIFRISYFGDLWPNPFYAKASEANFLRLLNIVGGGWDYVLSWLMASGLFFAIPLLIIGMPNRVPLPIASALAVAGGHIAFVLYAGGDWMGQWRFMSPVVPLLAIVVAYALDNQDSCLAFTPRRQTVCVVLALVLSLCTAKQLAWFRADPTTPLERVAEIGKQFREVARRLGIDHPTLAHHDAGGTSYGAVIDLIDLGGLGNRAVAKHMDDTDFVSAYLFEQHKPTFIFGSATNFAAGRSKFHLRSEFARDYVRLEFPGLPYMRGDLCHMRRDRVREAPGIEVTRAPEGTVMRVIVR